MRHFFWYTTDGGVGGMMTRIGGFPPDSDPSDPNTKEEVARGLRKTFTAMPNYGGIIRYDCPCPSDHQVCPCANARTRDSFVDRGKLVALPDVRFVVDGVTVENDATIDATPSSDVQVKLVGEVPDGVVAYLRRTGVGPDLARSFPVGLTFLGGETPAVALRAPGQGFTGSIIVGDRRYIPVRRLSIRGW